MAKGGGRKRKSPRAKSGMMRETMRRHPQNQVKFRYISADSWYSPAESMGLVNKRRKTVIFELKDSRKAADSGKKRRPGQFERLDQMKTPGERPMKAWAKDLEFPAPAFGHAFKSKGGTEGAISGDK
jgi:hypothetical protein